MSGDLEALRAALALYREELARALLALLEDSPAGLAACRPPLRELARFAAARDAEAFRAALSAPSTAAAVWTRRGLEDLAPRLLLELARRGLLPEGGAEADSAADLGSPELGAVLRRLDPRGPWRFENGRVAAGSAPPVRLSAQTLAGRRPGAAGLSSELACVPVADGIVVALADWNPLSPAGAGGAVDLGGRSEEDWRQAAVQSAAWIAELWPELYAEMTVLLKQIVPLGSSKSSARALVFREALGAVYLTWHPNPLAVTLALVEGLARAELDLASWSDPLLESGRASAAWAALAEAQAALAAAGFLSRLEAAGHPLARAADFAPRRAEAAARAAQSLTALEDARWTPAGRARRDRLAGLFAGA